MGNDKDPVMGKRVPRRAARLASRAVVVLCLGSAGFGGSAAAQDPAGDPPPGGWTFQVSPYGWLAGLKGTVGTRPALPTVDVDVGFDDILENMDFAFMLLAEARYGRIGFIADIAYLAVGADADTPGPLFSRAEADSDVFFGTFAPAYRVVDRGATFVDLLAGMRIWSIDNEVDFKAGLLPSVKTKSSESWVDPIVGFRGHLDLGSGFTAMGYFDIGGFGAASDLTWQVYGGLGYRINSWVRGSAGYRHLSVDYEDGGFVWDVELSGPMLGFTFVF